LSSLVGSYEQAEAAVIFDWQNAWAIEGAAGPRPAEKNYLETCADHHLALWRRGIKVDCIQASADLTPYRLVIAPMLYQVRPGVAKALTDFVERGGILLCSYLSGWADQDDLCFTGGFPGPLRPLLGIWAEEMDILLSTTRQQLMMSAGNHLGLQGNYPCRHYAEVIHSEGAEVLGTYSDDFYAGMPALTCNRLGAGSAYMVATRVDQSFTDALIDRLATEAAIHRPWQGALPRNVQVQVRADHGVVMNFGDQSVDVSIPDGWVPVLEPRPSNRVLNLPPFTSSVLRSTTRVGTIALSPGLVGAVSRQEPC
jgi:beta-galactosidase